MDRPATVVHGLTRRRFLQGSAALAGLGLVSGCGGMPPWAQPPKVRRIGYLDVSDARDETQSAPYRDRLRELGWVEGENLVIEERFARGDPTRFPSLIAELDALGVECIVCGGMAGCIPLKQANLSTPAVVWQLVVDVVDAGLVQNIARPEGSMTGIAGVSGLQFHSKLLEVLNAAVPGARRVGVLADAKLPALDVALQGLKDAASRLGLQLEITTVTDGSGIESAISTLSVAGAQALLVVISTIFLTNDVRPRIAELARVHRLPLASPDSALPRAGGLLAYSPNRPEVAYRVAWYVDQILKGVKPADLPMERPTRFDFVINKKTADELGLTIPPSVLAQATEIIQ